MSAEKDARKAAKRAAKAERKAAKKKSKAERKRLKREGKFLKREKPGQSQLRELLKAQRPAEKRFNKLQTDFERSASSRNLQRRIEAGASSAVQQRFRAVGGPNRFANTLEQTLRRAKARQGIVNRGIPATENQKLRNRISIARQKISRSGQVTQGLANSVRIASGRDAARQQASGIIGSSIFGAAGAITGGVVRGLGDRFFGPKDPVDPVTTGEPANVDFSLGTGP